MKPVKNKDTRIELMPHKELWCRNLRYGKNPKKVFRHPDIAFIYKKIAVFRDSEFRHGHGWENAWKNIRFNREFRIPEIERNTERDSEANEVPASMDRIVIIFRGKEIRKDVKRCADVVEEACRKK